MIRTTPSGRQITSSAFYAYSIHLPPYLRFLPPKTINQISNKAFQRPYWINLSLFTPRQALLLQQAILIEYNYKWARNVYKMKLNKMGPLGLEPRTHGLWVRCSNQLSYGPRNDLWSDQVLYFIIMVTSFELNLRPLICKQREGVYQFSVLVSSVLFHSGYSQETN